MKKVIKAVETYLPDHQWLVRTWQGIEGEYMANVYPKNCNMKNIKQLRSIAYGSTPAKALRCAAMLARSKGEGL